MLRGIGATSVAGRVMGTASRGFPASDESVALPMSALFTRRTSGRPRRRAQVPCSAQGEDSTAAARAVSIHLTRAAPAPDPLEMVPSKNRLSEPCGSRPRSSTCFPACRAAWSAPRPPRDARASAPYSEKANTKILRCLPLRLGLDLRGTPRQALPARRLRWSGDALRRARLSVPD